LALHELKPKKEGREIQETIKNNMAISLEQFFTKIILEFFSCYFEIINFEIYIILY